MSQAFHINLPLWNQQNPLREMRVNLVLENEGLAPPSDSQPLGN